MFEELVVKSDNDVEGRIGFAVFEERTKSEVVGLRVPSRLVGEVGANCTFNRLDSACSFGSFDELELLLSTRDFVSSGYRETEDQERNVLVEPESILFPYIYSPDIENSSLHLADPRHHSPVVVVPSLE